LRHLAAVLREAVRRTDVIARWGGEGFAVLLPETSKEAALALAERAREAVAATDWSALADGRRVTVRAGVATAAEAERWFRGWPEGAVTPENGTAPEGMDLLKLADGRLYSAKESGRNRTASA